MSTDILTILDFIGVISFTISGSLMAIRKQMDYLGVCILGIVTSVGGGATRDILIGRTPPTMFTQPVFVAVAFIVANIVFILLYFHLASNPTPSLNHLFENTNFWFDTIGLASFTANGVIVGMNLGEASVFLCAFLGVITGVGGGVLRDLLANEVPAIFVKHVYAVASIAGALAISLLWETNNLVAVAVCLALVVLIRFLARHFRWNLPKIR